MKDVDRHAEPIRVGYFVPEFPSQTHAFFWREYSALQDAGVEASLISTRRPERDSCRHSFSEEAHAKTHYVFPPSIWALLVTLFSTPRGIWRCVKYIRHLDESTRMQRIRLVPLVACAADLYQFSRENGLQHIHVHSLANAAYVVAMCRLLGGPTYSVTAHGDLPVYGTDHRAKLSQSSFSVAVTRPLVRQLADRTGQSADSIHLVWMGVNTDEFVPPPVRSRRRAGLHLVTVARLNLTKGHEYALRAIRRAVDQGHDVRYTIAGAGPHLPAIEATVRDLRLDDRVELVGMVDEAGVKRLLADADAFILSSFGFGEAAPVSVMEAMATALPVICSRIGGTTDMIDDGVDGLLVDQKDVDGLAEAIGRLAEDHDLRERLARAAREKAVEEFDSRKVAMRLLEILRNQILKPARPRPTVVKDATRRIGYLIPEFPGQTHTFFWRERRKLAECGIQADIVSTRRPSPITMSRHSWTDQAMVDTAYLHRSNLRTWLTGLGECLRSDIRAIAECLGCIERAKIERPMDLLQLFAAFSLGGQLKRLARQKDWSHIHVHSCANALHVAMFSRLLGGPSYSMTLHGPLRDYGFNQPMKWRYASFAIVITEKLRREVFEQIPENDRPPISVAGMGVDTQTLARSTTYRPPTADGSIRIFTCSRLNAVKRTDDLVRAVRIAHDRGLDVRLRVAGEDESPGMPMRRRLISLMRELAVDDYVTLLGTISETKVMQELEEAQVFALVSMEEPLGVATMEAMTMELPVIITSTGGAVELVDDGVHGLHVPPREPDAIADAIEYLIDHPEQAIAMGQRGRQRIIERYDSSVSAKLIADQIASLDPSPSGDAAEISASEQRAAPVIGH